MIKSLILEKFQRFLNQAKPQEKMSSIVSITKPYQCLYHLAADFTPGYENAFRGLNVLFVLHRIDQGLHHESGVNCLLKVKIVHFC